MKWKMKKNNKILKQTKIKIKTENTKIKAYKYYNAIWIIVYE